MATKTLPLKPTFIAHTELHTFNCGSCGGVYAISERFRSDCYVNGTGWHCPYCQCRWGYFTNNKHKELEDALQRERAMRDQAESDARHQCERRAAAERSVRSLKGVVTRTKKRLGKGVCPCCNRHFRELERHMNDQHPEYFAEQD